MPRTYRKKRPTRELILKTGMRMFLENGFSATACSGIAKELHISPGNLTFYFPTKVHLLTELVKELYAYQWKVMSEAAQGNSELYAFCLELAAMAHLCEVAPTAKDFYVSAYIHPMSLELIRTNDAQKAQKIFAEFCPNFSEEDYICTANLISGIEYATLVTQCSEGLTLSGIISRGLNCMLQIYGVPEEIRCNLISQVLASDYGSIGERIFVDFIQHVDAINEQAVQDALEYRRQYDQKRK